MASVYCPAFKKKYPLSTKVLGIHQRKAYLSAVSSSGMFWVSLEKSKKGRTPSKSIFLTSATLSCILLLSSQYHHLSFSAFINSPMRLPGCKVSNEQLGANSPFWTILIVI